MVLHSQLDEPGTQREYETIFIVRPDSEVDTIREVNNRVRRVINDASGKLLRVENWGKRKLAYEMKKNNKGIYLYWRYLANPDLIFEIERNLRMLDAVLRYMTVKVDINIDPNARPSEVTDESLDAAAETAPDEEDLFLRMGRGDRSRFEEKDDDFEDSDEDDDDDDDLDDDDISNDDIDEED